MEKTWSQFLTASGLCQEDPLTGNRPCDSGRLCATCQTEEVRQQYETWKAAPEGLNKKETIKLLEQHFEVKAKYMGTPSFTYQLQAGEEIYTITREGKIEDAAGRPIDLDSIIGAPRPETAEATQDFDTVEITLPLAGHTGISLKNLVNMIYSKQTLIQKALGLEGRLVDEELVKMLSDKKPESVEDFKALLLEAKHQICPGINFDFEKELITFKFSGLSPEQIKAGSELIALINKNAQILKFVSSRLSITDNEMYTFRTWLLRLGMIGDEYKTTRKTLLANLEGNGAYRRTGKKHE